MKVVGLTGGIGAGKTTIARFFQLLETPVFFADIQAKKILHGEAHNAVVKVFGNQIVTENQINRKKLAQIVFKDSKALTTLNKIIHGLLKEQFNQWVLLKKEEGYRYVLLDAAILFEIGWHKEVDSVLLVTSPIEERIVRVMKRDGISKEEVEQRLSSQWLDEERIPLSTFVIQNSTNNLILPTLLEIHQTLTIC